MPSFGRHGVFALLASAGLALLAACSVIVTGGRCSVDADCGGRGAAAVCRSGACIASSEAASGDAAVRSCQTNAECAARLGDELAVCEKVQYTCVKLSSPDCTRVHGDWKNDRAIYVGTLFKQGDTAGDLGASPDAIAAIELAFDEIKNDRGGLPDRAGGAARPLVAVECNQTQDAVRAARFLSEQVHVPAILGAASTYVTIQVASQVTVPNGTFLIKRRSIFIRPRKKALFRTVNQPGIDLGHGIITQSQPIQRTRPEVFDQHVCPGDEIAGYGQPIAAFQIKAN